MQSGPSLSPSNVLLLEAAEKGDNKAIIKALQKGAYIETKNSQGWTPLMLTAKYGHILTMEILLQRHAALETTDNCGWTALMHAAINDHFFTLKLLIEHGANLDITANDSWTPLMFAARDGYINIVNILLQHNATLEGNGNLAPLKLAALFQHIPIVKVLLLAGAPYNPIWLQRQSSEIQEFIHDHNQSITIETLISEKVREITSLLDSLSLIVSQYAQPTIKDIRNNPSILSLFGLENMRHGEYNENTQQPRAIEDNASPKNNKSTTCCLL